MAIRKVLARGWTLEVEDPVGLLWYTVTGLMSFTFETGKNNAPTTTFDSAGQEEHQVASRNRRIGFEGKFLEDQTSKERDDGQYYMEYVADQIGVSSVANFRLTSPAGTIRTFEGSVNIGSVGGGNDDATDWSGEIEVSGAVDSGVSASTGMSAFVFLNVDGVSALTGETYIPPFAIGTYVYAFTFNTETSFKVKATAASHTIKMYVNGTLTETLTTATASTTSIAISAATAKRIDIVVHEDGKTKLTYTFMVGRTA